jgi:hypothetical protein
MSSVAAESLPCGECQDCLPVRSAVFKGQHPFELLTTNTDRLYTSAQDTYISMSALSALGLLRSRGPRAFASIATPQRLQFHRPRHMSNIRVKDNATVIKEYEQDMKTALEDPKLNDEQKFRLSQRLYALIDYRVALNDVSRIHEKTRAAVKHVGGLDVEAQAAYHKGPMKNLLQELLATQIKKSTLLWQAYRLIVFAPWGDVKFSERATRLIELLVFNGLLAPFRRSRIRAALFYVRILEKM